KKRPRGGIGIHVAFRPPCPSKGVRVRVPPRPFDNSPPHPHSRFPARPRGPRRSAQKNRFLTTIQLQSGTRSGTNYSLAVPNNVQVFSPPPLPSVENLGQLAMLVCRSRPSGNDRGRCPHRVS